jgi:hypothetical protein
LGRKVVGGREKESKIVGKEEEGRTLDGGSVMELKRRRKEGCWGEVVQGRRKEEPLEKRKGRNMVEKGGEGEGGRKCCRGK